MSQYPDCREFFIKTDETYPFFIKLEPTRHVLPHHHQFLEFSLVAQGSGSETVNGETHTMQPGTLVLLLPHQIHEIHRKGSDDLLLYICNFDLELLLNPYEKEWGIQSLLLQDTSSLPAFVQLDQEQFMNIKANFEEMLKEYEHQTKWSKILIKNKLSDSLVIFDRIRQPNYRPAADGLIPDKKHIWEIIEYLNANYRLDITLNSLAEQFNFDPSYLSKLFKRNSGLNFVRFMHELRIRNACSLLLSTQLSVAQIAVEVGFSSFQSFSRVFSEIKGMTPSAYRKANATLKTPGP